MIPTYRNQPISLILFLVFLFGLASARNLHAQTDTASLKNAIEAANRSGSGSITLTEDILLDAQLPPIRGAITIDGNGYTISGDEQFRIFHVDGGELLIRNLTLTQGYTPDDGGAIFVQNNGALLVDSVTFARNHSVKGGGAISTHPSADRLEVRNSEFVGNHSGSGGGGILAFGGHAEISGSSFQENSAVRFGGGLEAFVGVVDISNSTFSNNRADSAGAILVSGATTTMTHLTLLDNRANGPNGDSIIRREGVARLFNSIVAGGSTALDCGGGLQESSGNFSADGSCAQLPGGDPLLAEVTGSPAYFPLQDGSPAVDSADSRYCLDVDQRGEARPQGGSCDIGAFESATATAAEPTPTPTECTLANHILSANTNTSVGRCPTGTSHDVITLTEDIVLSEALPPINGTITIEGNGHSISGDNKFQIFVVAGRTLTINNLTLAHGSAEGDGGAIVVQGNAELVVNHSTFERNRIDYIEDGDRLYGGYGGAIGTQRFSGRISINNSVFTANEGELGGGALYITGGTTTIHGSTFTRNRGQGFGGAIEVTGGQVNIENSTFNLNSSSNGGAISITGGNVTMTHLTLVDNRSSYAEGSAVRHWGGSARLRNSIVSGIRGLPPDCHGNINLSGNFSQDGSCGTTEAVDPQLGKITGSPGYFPPLENSPLVDAADPAFCLATDQTGKTRPIGGGCDIGAIELASVPQAQADSATDSQDGSACRVTATRSLDLHDVPQGNRIGSVFANTTLPATARTQAWFRVEVSGVLGWISAEYVTTAGICG